MMQRSCSNLARWLPSTGRLPIARTAIRFHYSYESAGHYTAAHESLANRDYTRRGFTVGIGGPVGSGKTALCQKLSQSPELLQLRLGIVTNDIFTQEDADFLHKNTDLPADRIQAVETGGCPHAAIREDVSANLSALEELTRNNENALLLCESGGDNLAANFSHELADLTLYVIDVAGGDKVPRKGGPGITQSDLLIINKIDLAEAVGADLGVMERDANRMRTASNGSIGPTIFAAIKHKTRLPEIIQFILQRYHAALGDAALGMVKT